MDEIPKAVWQIHAKLNEKEMRLKAKERALQACEDALIAREKAITIRENAIDEKVLKFGLHEYDPKLSSAKNGGGNIDQRSKRSDHLLPSFAANTQCPKDSSDTELEVEAAAACENQEAKENDCAPESNIRSLNEVLPEKHISITDPESMSSQLLHLFDNLDKVGAQKNSCGISLVRKHAIWISMRIKLLFLSMLQAMKILWREQLANLIQRKRPAARRRFYCRKSKIIELLNLEIM